MSQNKDHTGVTIYESFQIISDVIFEFGQLLLIVNVFVVGFYFRYGIFLCQRRHPCDYQKMQNWKIY